MNLFEKLGIWKDPVYILIGIAALYNSNLITILPFLGETVFPNGILQPIFPKGANVEYTIDNLPPNVDIVYWGASKDGGGDVGPNIAYDEYKNAGISKSDEFGVAKLKFMCPSTYSVYGRALPKHIHYRYTISPGLLSDVFTSNIKC
jgi:hypothetical protein